MSGGVCQIMGHGYLLVRTDRSFAVQVTRMYIDEDFSS